MNESIYFLACLKNVEFCGSVNIRYGSNNAKSFNLGFAGTSSNAEKSILSPI